MAVTEEVSPLEKKIIRQIEYYFGDFNLAKDKFMKETVKENDGWVDMETMLKFKRLAGLSTDAKEIMAALKKSSTGLMEVSEEGEGKIRRSPSNPMPENVDDLRKQMEAKTAYAKGFDKEKTTMDELLEYYNEHNPAVVNIQMRNYFDSKTKEKHFKGSVFLTFKTEEDCKAFVEAESQEYKGKKLEAVKFQKAYLEEKSKEYEERKKNKKGKGNKDAGKEANNQAKEDDNMEPLPLGTVIKFTGLGGDITREDIKDKLAADFGVNIDKAEGDVAFVTYQKGEAEAKIRFKVENFGKTLMEKIEKAEKLMVKDMEVKAILLEGEEEKKYLEEAVEELKNMKARQKNHKRKGGFGKGQGNNKRQRK